MSVQPADVKSAYVYMRTSDESNRKIFKNSEQFVEVTTFKSRQSNLIQASPDELHREGEVQEAVGRLQLEYHAH